jgi:hypothetical protein
MKHWKYEPPSLDNDPFPLPLPLCDIYTIVPETAISVKKKDHSRTPFTSILSCSPLSNHYYHLLLLLTLLISYPSHTRCRI